MAPPCTKPNQSKPKAIVGRTLSQNIINKTYRLLVECESIPLLIFPSLYRSAYGDVLDASELGFDEGLIGLFNALPNIFSTKTVRGRVICSLSQFHLMARPNIISASDTVDRPISSNIAKYSRCFSAKDMRSETLGPSNYPDYSWQNPHSKEIVAPSHIVIPLSPLEHACEMNPERVKFQAWRIHMAIRKHRNGVNLSDLAHLISVDKTLFNVTSIESMVHQYPEIFYVEGRRDDELLVFDGKTTNHITRKANLLNQLGDSWIFPALYCHAAVKSGIYQMSLMLIRESGEEGLRLGVWKQALISNFRPSMDACFVTNILMQDPIAFFLALESYNMVAIKSHPDSMNDLRLFIASGKSRYREVLKIIYNYKWIWTVKEEKSESTST